MKLLHIFVFVLLLIFLGLVSDLVMNTSNTVTIHAQAATPSFGDYGYTYNIKPPAQPTSQYNVFGEVKYSSGFPTSISKFQTYAVRQGGPVISQFDKLKLRGRVWYQGETGCPLNIYADKKWHWPQAHGGYNSHVLNLSNPADAFPRYAISKHKLVHQDAWNLATPPAPPNRFIVWIDDATNPANGNLWKGIHFGCPSPPVDLPPDDF